MAGGGGRRPKITNLQKRKNVHEMGRRGSKITFNHCVLHHFSRYGWWWHFWSKINFLTNYENSIKKHFGSTYLKQTKIHKKKLGRKRHHQPYLEKLRRTPRLKVIFEPRRPISWTFLRFCEKSPRKSNRTTPLSQPPWTPSSPPLWPSSQPIIKIEKCSKLVKNHGFDQNGGHHELRLEKSLKMQRFLLIFEPRRPISWTFLCFC